MNKDKMTYDEKLKKIKEKVEFAISCSKTVGGKKADIATWAYQNVLDWIIQIESENND